MSLLEIFFLGVALAMDCFTVSVAAGISARSLIMRPMARLTVCFGLFQGGMTLLGYFGTSFFSSWIESFDHWIAFALLMYLGINMIRSGFTDNEEKQMDLLAGKNVVTLSIATSIDALAVGISLACVDSNIWFSAMVIAICSSLFTIVGLALGIMAGKKITFPVEPIGGIVLICIGIKVLMENI